MKVKWRKVPISLVVYAAVGITPLFIAWLIFELGKQSCRVP